jgi:hypothetical protein
VGQACKKIAIPSVAPTFVKSDLPMSGSATYKRRAAKQTASSPMGNSRRHCSK